MLCRVALLISITLEKYEIEKIAFILGKYTLFLNFDKIYLLDYGTVTGKE